VKANEFITESINDTISDIVNEYTIPKEYVDFIKYISENCKPFLEEIDYKIFSFPVYRGIESVQMKKKFMTVQNVRLENRRPKDMPREVHDKLNELFIRKFKEPFRDALFVTGDSYFAEGYGTTYCVFPVGEFSFIWSKNIKDLFELYEEYIDGYPDVNINQFIPDLSSTMYSYTDNNFKAGVTSDNEIMIRCQRVVCILSYTLLYNPTTKQKEGINKLLELLR